MLKFIFSYDALRTICEMTISYGILLLGVIHLSATGPGTTWIKIYGGVGTQEGHSVYPTSDGGYIIAGSAKTNDDLNVYLLKTDSIGISQWTKTYGGPYNDCALSIQETSDGGYIVTGYVNSSDSTYSDVYLMKTNINGDTLWTKTFGDTLNDEGWSVQQTTDGGYVIVGSKTDPFYGMEMYLIKTDANGDTLWTRVYGDLYSDSFDYYGSSVQQTSDGDYIIVGTRIGLATSVSDALYIIKTDHRGDTLWTKVYDGLGDDRGYSVRQTVDGGYVFAGRNGLFKGWLIKTDPNGHTRWSRFFPGYSCSVISASGRGYIFTGWIGNDVYLVKVDANGEEAWKRTFGGSGNDYGHCVQRALDGGYIIAGTYFAFGEEASDIYLIKIDKEGLQPNIWLDPFPLEASVQLNGMTKKALTIGNNGEGGSLNWTISVDTSKKWLSVHPQYLDHGHLNYGILAPDSSTEVNVTFDAVGLNQGHHLDNLLIRSNDSLDSIINIPVTLIVLPEDTLFVYPSPFVPQRGHGNIIFANIPEQGVIEVYTIANRLVWRHEFADIGRHYKWDVKTDNGKDVASGVYIYVVKDGQDKVLAKQKFAIIR